MAGGSLYGGGDDEGGAITEINVTPFVDVALVLLVIFLVTARLIVARGIVVDKPKGTATTEIKATLRLTVDKAGALYVNGTPFTDDAAATAKIVELAKDMPESRVIITGDTGAAYGSVMHAITIAKAAKIQKIALENEPPKAK